MTGDPGARSFGRSAGVLSAGVGAAGLLTYVFFALAAHNLDATAYGEIVVLWSADVRHDLGPPPPGGAVHLAQRRRAPNPRPADRPDAADRGADRGRGRGRVRSGGARPARPASGRPLLGIGDPLLGLRRRGARVCGQLLRPGLPRRRRALRPAGRAAGLGVVLADGVLARRRGGDRRRSQRGRGGDPRRPADLAHRSPARLRPSGARAAAPGLHRAGRFAHPHARRRVRGRGSADHAQRADLPQRGAAARAGRGRRRGRRLHLQRADGRAGAAARLPGDRDQPAAPPHPAALARRRSRGGGVRGLRRHDPAGDRRVHGAGRCRGRRSPARR